MAGRWSLRPQPSLRVWLSFKGLEHPPHPSQMSQARGAICRVVSYRSRMALLSTFYHSGLASSEVAGAATHRGLPLSFSGPITKAMHSALEAIVAQANASVPMAQVRIAMCMCSAAAGATAAGTVFLHDAREDMTLSSKRELHLQSVSLRHRRTTSGMNSR